MFYPHTTLTLTLTPSHPYSSGKKASCLPGILWMGVRFNRQGAKKAAVYRQYSYAALLVQLCCTFGARMLYSSGTTKTVGIPMLDYWYSYAEPLVFLCWTFGIPMLNLWYQNALLFWYRFFNLFTGNIKARIRMKKRSSAAGGKANEELSAVGRLRNKVRRPNFVS